MNGRIERTLRRAGIVSSVLFVVLAYVLTALAPFPELDDFLERRVSRTLFDRTGALLYSEPLENGLRREYVLLEKIPQSVRRIFLTSEDRRFFIHPGVDPASLIRSAYLNLVSGRIVSGASTVTMQLSRLIRPHGGGFRGKIGEAFTALRLEARLSKGRILELWFNSLPFSYGVEGIQSASRLFFSTSCDGLTDAEASLLALIPRRPAAYNPDSLNADGLEKARVLLSEAGSLDGEQRLTEALERFDFHDRDFEAPHFSLRTLDSLSAAYAGNGERSSEIITSLDLELTRFAEDRLQAELSRHASSRLSAGAVLVLDNGTGEVLSYVGSPSFFDDAKRGQIDGVRVENQPGSTLKPFLYAYALDRGFTANSVLPDIPTDFGTEEVYTPSNFNGRFNGPVRLRVALSSSLNVPAVHVLSRVSVRSFSDFLISAGFDSIIRQRDTLGTGLALGNAEVSLEELTTAFALFPRGGVPLEPVFLKSDEFRTGGSRLLSEYASYTICDILSDGASRFTGFGRARNFSTEFPAMFKTGTANQYQNIWAFGASAGFTVGVWLGNFTGETVIGRTGSSIPLSLVKAILERLEYGTHSRAGSSGNRPGGGFPEPPGTSRVRICALSGMNATSACEGSVFEYVPTGSIPGDCTWHSLSGGSRIVTYPAEFERWVSSGRYGTIANGDGGPEIVSPKDGAVYFIDPSAPPGSQAVAVRIRPGEGVHTGVFVDGMFSGVPDGTEWLLELEKGMHIVEIRDEEGRSSRIKITVR